MCRHRRRPAHPDGGGADAAARKKLLAEANLANDFTNGLSGMPVQRPYNQNTKHIAELMWADEHQVNILG